MTRLILAALAIAFGVILPASIANSQFNPFNPDLSWCNTQGAIATRKATQWNCLLPGAAGQVVQSGGPGADIAWLTVTGTGTVTSVGATVPSFMAVTGSPITAAGSLGFSFNNQLTNLVFASPDGSTGAPAFRSLAVNDIPTLTAAKLPNAGVMTGDVTTTFPAVTIANSAVTNAKIATNTIGFNRLINFPASTILANLTAGSTAAAAVSANALLDYFYGTTQGAILYRNATVWTLLPPGTGGQFLMTNGAAANPQWNGVSGATGGTVTSVTCGNGLTGGTFTLTGTCAMTSGQFPGTATNDNATAGNIGQEVTANVLTSSGVVMGTSGTNYQITTISLTAGDWDISATGMIQPNNLVPVSIMTCAVNTATATIQSDQPGLGRNAQPFTQATGAGFHTLAITPFRVSLSGTTSYYLNCVMSGGVATGAGMIRARRMR